jgi:predicted phosphodiesterase
MKILIFSDTHLGKEFDQKKFEALKQIIEPADRVIINGDFWDYHLCSWEEFLDSPWNTLFPLLKERKAQYTFGNHDPKSSFNEKAHVFCDHFDTEVRINVGDTILRIQHGNKIVPSIDETMPLLLKVKPLVRLSYIFFNIGVRLFGKMFLKIGTRKNKKMKNWIVKNLKKDEILICGHSHWAESNIEKQYINSGLVRFGYLEYVKIEEGRIHLQKDYY